MVETIWQKAESNTTLNRRPELQSELCGKKKFGRLVRKWTREKEKRHNAVGAAIHAVLRINFAPNESGRCIASLSHINHHFFTFQSALQLHGKEPCAPYAKPPPPQPNRIGRAAFKKREMKFALKAIVIRAAQPAPVGLGVARGRQQLPSVERWSTARPERNICLSA